MTKDKPQDFIRYVCMKCPNVIDENPFSEGCVTYATRDCAPTLCPCRGEPEWEIEQIMWREGERP